MTYAHDFTTQGMGDWVTQPGTGATVSVSSSHGLGVEVTGEDQWAEVISSDAVIGPNSFVQGLVYIPPGPNGYTANWPAFWSTGSPWPNNGEIDMLEGQEGRSCEQTHYGELQPHGHASGNSVSKCGPLGSSSTGWLTVSMLRTGEQVEVWYNKTFVGKVPLPTTANQKLIFQNQDGPNNGCLLQRAAGFPVHRVALAGRRLERGVAVYWLKETGLHPVGVSSPRGRCFIIEYGHRTGAGPRPRD